MKKNRLLILFSFLVLCGDSYGQSWADVGSAGFSAGPAGYDITEMTSYPFRDIYKSLTKNV